MKLCMECEQTFSGEDTWICPFCGFTPETRNGYPSFANPEGGDGFHPDAFSKLVNVESEHFWFRSRNSLIVRVLRRCFPHLKSFLEVGCGTGFVLSGVAKNFSAARISGSEYFSEGLHFASDRIPHASFCQADARALPFVNEFDVIGAFDVLEHIDEDNVVLSMFHRALHSGGGIILTVPQHRWLWSRSDEDACHVRRYTKSELIYKIEKSGFCVEYVSSFVFLLLPLMLLSRLRKRTDKRSNEQDEMKINPLINNMFLAIMWMERAIMSCGVRFPCGGSLLLVGRKKKD